MISNGVRIMVFQAVFDERPVIIRDLMEFLEHPPYSGSFTIHSVNGKISFADKKETIKD